MADTGNNQEFNRRKFLALTGGGIGAAALLGGSGILAACGSDGVRTNNIRAHAIVASMSRPTFFRALKSLVGKGYLEQSGSASRGRYLVKAPK